VLLEDRDFYETSGGGITLSGGECLLQPDACREILSKMKAEGINTAVDTCGDVPFENIEKVIEYTDVFLYDLKAIDEDVHKKCTGRSNRRLLENLKKIDALGKKIEVRIPFVPNFNDTQMDKILDTVAELKNLVRVRVLAYHDFARSKYRALDIDDTLPKELPKEDCLEKIREKFRARGIECMN
jgi:pyruvate formate lyase activating enzyme